MLDGTGDDNLLLRLQHCNDILVCILYVLALEIRHGVDESTGIVERAGGHLVFSDDTVRDGDSVVVFTESGGLVDDTSTGGGIDVRIADDSVGLVFELSEDG